MLFHGTREVCVLGWCCFVGPLTVSCGSESRVHFDSPGTPLPANGDSAPPDARPAAEGDSASPPAAPGSEVTIDGSVRTARSATSVGVNYWLWPHTWGNYVAETTPEVQPLSAAILRMGGHNNDNNDPDPFDDAAIDQAVSYARAIGAEPILQVPLLADVTGAKPTVQTAVGMVTYANVTKGYGVKYFSIGNEPDNYPDQEANLGSYTAADYCASVKELAPAMRKADPHIQILGPELSWRYNRPGNDWLTPILADCGSHFDIVSVHRYPLDPTDAMVDKASTDAESFRQALRSVRVTMQTLGQQAKPLAVTEANISWNGDPEKSTLQASPGTLAAGLWTADMFGVAFEEGLWTTAFWSIREDWTLGLLTHGGEMTPSYRALQLYAAHFGTTLLTASGAPDGVRVYASRNEADDATLAIVINWNLSAQPLTFRLKGLAMSIAPSSLTLGPRTMNAVEIPDTGATAVWVYGAAQLEAKSGPVQ